MVDMSGTAPRAPSHRRWDAGAIVPDGPTRACRHRHRAS